MAYTHTRGGAVSFFLFSGKLGAFVGSLFFKAAVTVLEGVGPVLIICALLSLAGEGPCTLNMNIANRGAVVEPLV